MKIETLADALDQTARHTFHGTAIMAFAVLVYGRFTGIVGDAFVTVAHELGANVAIIAFSLFMMLGAYGALHLLEGLFRIALPTTTRSRGR